MGTEIERYAGKELVAARNQIDNPKQRTGANHRDEKAGKPFVGMETDKGKQEVTYTGTDNANNNVAQEGSIMAHELSGQPADKGAANEGPQDGKKHGECLLFKNLFAIIISYYNQADNKFSCLFIHF